MNWFVVQRLLGLLLILFSFTMLPPIGVAFLFDGRAWLPFAEAFLASIAAGVIVWLPVRRVRKELRLRDGFLVVAAFWTVLGTFGALPLLFSEDPRLGFTDALFESVSGLTTTGATVLVGIDELPKSILWYRHQLQWIGGMGLIVAAVAILPMLGVGGMQLYRAETPGPVKDTKLTPRIAETAKALWYIYLGFTIACSAAYWLAGMSVFDAICHAFSTVSIGGFSTHDLNVGYFDSAAIDMVAIVFMFVAGINFSLHFFAWRYVSIRHYARDPEVRAYFLVVVVVSAVVVATLVAAGTFTSPRDGILNGLFQAVSIATTTGFTTANYSDWPGAIPVLLVFSSFIGGCAGSTAGGIKVIRWLLIYKQGVREIVRLVHPSAEIPVKLGSHAVPYRVVDAIWGFFSVYLIVFGFMLLAMMAAGLDQVTAFSAVAASLNNLGPGLGDVAIVFQTGDAPKWIAVAGMLLGRLEIFTLLVILSPTFWRR
ncbi:MAG TPA: TrkH family potassium uptake protein [Woeseiaceae bacterium]|nr:TrkH family potassium uptake protein [Woeseiaceae bacterium]